MRSPVQTHRHLPDARASRHRVPTSRSAFETFCSQRSGDACPGGPSSPGLGVDSSLRATRGTLRADHLARPPSWLLAPSVLSSSCSGGVLGLAVVAGSDPDWDKPGGQCRPHVRTGKENARSAWPFLTEGLFSLAFPLLCPSPPFSPQGQVPPRPSPSLVSGAFIAKVIVLPTFAPVLFRYRSITMSAACPAVF